MGNNYLKYPVTVKALAEEIKIACNDYFARNIDNDTIKEIISWYAKNQSDKLFCGKDINSTISKIIGKKRVNLISVLLNDLEQQARGLPNE